MVSKISDSTKEAFGMKDAFDIYMAATFRELGTSLYEQDKEPEHKSLRSSFENLKLSSDNARGLKRAEKDSNQELPFDPINPFWAD